MHKAAIRSFAVYARRALIDAVTQRAYRLGITADGVRESAALTPEERTQREMLLGQILAEGFAQTMEEAAYTWFNRFIALRFLEVNGWLPSRVRVFTDENGDFQPELLAEAMHLGWDGLDRSIILACLDAQDNEGLYKYLLLAQCHALHACLPVMFEEGGGWTELLFPDNLLRRDSVLSHLVTDIPEEDWRGQVQIIGWLYQYYNTEPRNAVFSGMKRSRRITAEQIPAATQLFTPDWIVRYLVENTLGRLWAEVHGIPDNADWQYYIRREGESAARQLRPEEIKVLDPCMGSGHMLVYAFDVLMDIYTACGWSERDAARSILQNNLCGLDIDRRVYQLSYFALMMKARQYDRRALRDGGIQPNLACFADIAGEYPQAETLGSLMELPDSAALSAPARRIAQLLSQPYDAVVTNPPYMGSTGMQEELSDFVKKRYPAYKSDLFSVFMVRCTALARPEGYLGFLTPYVWMFLRSYEKLRELLYTEKTVESLIQLEYSAFEDATVPVCCFVLRNRFSAQKGCYLRLTEFRGGMEVQRQKALSAIADPACPYRYETDAAQLAAIPGMPAAYWLHEQMIRNFREGTPLKVCGDTRQGMATSDNRRFLRLWHEVAFPRIGIGCENAQAAQNSGCRWFPYNKGGDFRKWYGNIGYVVDYENDGEAVKRHAAALYRSASRTVKSMSEYFKPCLSWSKISSGQIAFRWYPAGFVFDVAGCCIFYTDAEVMYYDFGLVNSCVTRYILEAVSPTLNFEAGHVAALPVIRDAEKLDEIRLLTEENVQLCREDWDAFETSWNFKRHPLL